MKQWMTVFPIALASLALIGCAGHGKGANQQASSSQPLLMQFDPDIAQRDLMSFCDRFNAAMSDVYDQIAENAKTNDVRCQAMERKVSNVGAALVNGADPNSMIGMMNMFVMVRLIREASEDPWLSGQLGEGNAGLVETVLKSQEADITHLISRYLTPAQIEELTRSIEHWRRDHPDQRYVSIVRLSDFPEARVVSEPHNSQPGSVFSLLFLDPLASIDPAVREVARSREAAERMFFFAQRIPLVFSWQAEAVYLKMISVPQVETFVDNTSRFSSSTASFADSIKDFPRFFTEERKQMIEQLAKEVGGQRVEAIKQLADSVTAERESLLHDATTQLAKERDATIEQMQTAIQTQRQGLVSDVESASQRLLDRLFWLEMTMIVVAIGLTTIAVLIYRAIAARTSGADKLTQHRTRREHADV